MIVVVFICSVVLTLYVYLFLQSLFILSCIHLFFYSFTIIFLFISFVSLSIDLLSNLFNYISASIYLFIRVFF